MADMDLMYGLANGYSLESRRLYLERFRNIPGLTHSLSPLQNLEVKNILFKHYKSKMF